MAVLLRSVRFLRNICGLSRGFVLIPVARNERSFLDPSQTLVNNLKRGFATKETATVNVILQKIENHANRYGRISRDDVNVLLWKVCSGQGRSMDAAQCLLAIKCFGAPLTEEIPEIRTKLVQQLWASFVDQNVKLDIFHHNALLRVYGENGHTFSPAEFMASLEAKELTPNQTTYQRLVEQYCQQGNVDGATNMLMLMKEKNISINEQTFNALIIGYAQSGDLESAVGVISQMKERGLEPNIDTYTNVLCSYAKTGDLDAIRKTIDQCKAEDIQLPDRNILEVIYELSINGHSEKIQEIFQFAKKTEVYNQDAMNVSFRLVNQGLDNAAYTVLKTMQRKQLRNGGYQNTGDSLIKHMVKRNRPLNKIKAICENLEKSGLNRQALFTLRMALKIEECTESALTFLREMKANSELILPEHFFPLIRAEATNGDIGKLLLTLADEFDFKPNSRLIRDDVVRNMDLHNPRRVIETLKNAKVSTSAAVSSVIYHCFVNQQLKEAVDITYKYQTFLDPSIFQRPLILALKATNDFESFTKLVRYIHDNYSEKGKIKIFADKTDDGIGASGVLGEIVYNTLSALPQSQRIESFTKVLKDLVEQGLTISEADDKRIQAKLDSHLTDEILSLLTQLASGKLQPVPVERTRVDVAEPLTTDNLEWLVKSEVERGNDTTRLRQWLLKSLHTDGDRLKYMQCLEEFEKKNFPIAAGSYAMLIDLEANSNELDKALETFEVVRLKIPEFVLNSATALKIAHLLIEKNEVEKALKFLEANKRAVIASDTRETQFYSNEKCWKILNSLAEAGRAGDLQKVFDSLVANRFIEVRNALLGLLIRVHLFNDDIQTAVDTFEKLAKKYNSTPLFKELLDKLIREEDPTTLQRVVDISSRIHGESNVLFELALSFVDVGREKTARKIFETPNFIVNRKRFSDRCERYAKNGDIDNLEIIAKITKNLRVVDRSLIFDILLACCCSADLPERAQDLWVRMQEENETPTEQFLFKLGTFLKERNLDVPFVIPACNIPTTQSNIFEKPRVVKKPAKSVTNLRKPKTVTLTKFAEALESKDIDRIRETYGKLLPTDVLSVARATSLIENLVEANDLEEAKNIVIKLLNEGRQPKNQAFKFLLSMLAHNGDLQSLNELASSLSDAQKKSLFFQHFICQAYVASNREDEFLQQINDDMEKAISDEDCTAVLNTLPFGGLVGIISKNPSFLSKVEDMAAKWTTTKNTVLFQNVLWSYHLLNGNEEVCRNIWTKYLQSASTVKYAGVMKTAKSSKDVQLAVRIIDYVKTLKISEQELGAVHSDLMDIYCDKEQFDQALDVLNATVKGISINHLNAKTLFRIKEGIESGGKVFPYAITAPIPKSDDRKKQKRSVGQQQV